MLPLRGWILLVFVPPFSQKSGSHALSKAVAVFLAFVERVKPCPSRVERLGRPVSLTWRGTYFTTEQF
jgi:hypothetical protein